MRKALFLEVGKILSVYGFEEFAEMCDVIEPQMISNLLHAHIGIGGPALGFQDYTLADMVAGGIPGDPLDDLVEIIGGHRQFAGIVLYQFAGHVLFFHQGDEILYQADVLCLDGDLKGAHRIALPGK